MSLRPFARWVGVAALLVAIFISLLEGRRTPGRLNPPGTPLEQEEAQGGGHPDAVTSPAPAQGARAEVVTATGESGSADADLRVRVLTTQGRPLVAVQLSAVAGSLEVARDFSDSTGAATLEVPTGVEVRVEAALEGYRPAVRHVDPSRATQLTLVLWPSGQITGRVLGGRAEIDLEGVRVFAWPATLNPPRRAFASARSLRGFPLSVGQVREDGEFVLRDIALGLDHVLVAVGEDSLSGRVIASGHEDVQLQLELLYALHIELLGEPDEPIRATEGVFEGGLSWDVQEEGTSSVSLERAELGATGLDSWPDPDSLVSRDEQLLLFQSARDVPSIGPVELYASLPGYEELVTELQIPRLSREVAEARLSIQPLATPWGRLLVAGSAGALDPGAYKSLAGSLLGLLHLESPERELDIRVSAEWLLQGKTFELPAGEYEAWFETISGAYTYPREGRLPLSVLANVWEPGEQQATVFTLPLDDMTVVAIEVVEEISGEPFEAGLSLRFQLGDPTRAIVPTFRQSFKSAPYRVLGLPPGDYTVTVDWPNPNHGTPCTTPLQVVPFELGWLRLQVPATGR